MPAPPAMACALSGQGVGPLAQRALHQHDVDPPAELETDRLENADLPKTERLVEADRGDGLAPADHRDHLAVAELGATREQRRQQRPADAAPDFRRVDIDR